MKNIKSKVIVCISVAVLFIVSATSINAQKAEFGLRFMPTFSKFDVKTSSGGTVNGEANFGMGFGAFLGYNFNDHIGIQGEVIYSTASQKYKELDTERKINLRYVNLPLLLSLNTSKSKAFNLNAVVGPQIGISVGSSLKISNENGTVNPGGILSVKKGDLGLAYGAGIDFGLNPARSIRLGLGYRGVIGLVDISDDKNTITTDDFYVIQRTKLRSNALYAGLSILF